MKRRVGFHLISSKREWNNCFIKNYQQILLDFANFAWLERPEGNLMDAICRVWYNGSYTIAAKPIKTLELHYTMIQFLIIMISSRRRPILGKPFLTEFLYENFNFFLFMKMVKPDRKNLPHSELVPGRLQT